MVSKDVAVFAVRPGSGATRPHVQIALIATKPPILDMPRQHSGFLAADTGDRESGSGVITRTAHLATCAGHLFPPTEGSQKPQCMGPDGNPAAPGGAAALADVQISDIGERLPAKQPSACPALVKSLYSAGVMTGTFRSYCQL